MSVIHALIRVALKCELPRLTNLPTDSDVPDCEMLESSPA